MNTAVKKDTRIPIINVVAKPRIGPVPKLNRMGLLGDHLIHQTGVQGLAVKVADEDAVLGHGDDARLLFGKHKLILSVDRLDYSKGILHRLYGFASFLEHHPEYHGKGTFAVFLWTAESHVIGDNLGYQRFRPVRVATQ